MLCWTGVVDANLYAAWIQVRRHRPFADSDRDSWVVPGFEVTSVAAVRGWLAPVTVLLTPYSLLPDE